MAVENWKYIVSITTKTVQEIKCQFKNWRNYTSLETRKHNMKRIFHLQTISMCMRV